MSRSAGKLPVNLDGVPGGQGSEAGPSTLLGPVRTGNAFEETVERLLTVIKLGLVAPGDRFPAERELAARLGISRLTLREAIRELQQAGYVEPRRGRFGGTFVTYRPPEPSEAEAARLARGNAARLADALTFRMAVETGAAEALARTQSAGDGADGSRLLAGPRGLAADAGLDVPVELDGTVAGGVRELLMARLAAVNAAGPADYRRLDTLFHLSIAELTGSALLTGACADARMRLNDLLNAIPVLRRNIDHTASQHAAIAAAILAGDPNRARQAVAEHLEGTGSLLRGFLARPAP